MYCGALVQKVMWYVFRHALDSSTAVHKFKQLFVPVIELILLFEAVLELQVLTWIFGGRRAKSC